ncbi:hypothetical protein B0H17DRAFT_1106842 [Mycena rosella]|uniref:Protein kinase domain-containing protein n=1 Tax=Mycena rosella TaxID=1033263 RepID=A0AAD7C2S6_MYCRO|nr:hypothetical protein B0H17DRAFT_1106842 [Mycena rosella]
MSSRPDLRAVLSDEEIYWKDHQVWLQECGYMLRPLKRYSAEDGRMLSSGQVIDAIRLEDEASVLLKVISKDVHPDEAKICEYFSSEGVASDPRNHCIPLLAKLSPPDDEDKLILVMKLLRRYDSPRFDTFGEVMECFRQIFEGLHFMHQHRVAHRDCNSLNIMMDGMHLFPDGCHPQPQYQDFMWDSFKRARHYTRTQRPVKYYFIDFGISTMFAPGEDPRVEVIEGGDSSPPEFGTLEERRDMSMPPKILDPFPTDIYYLGNWIRTEFLEGYDLIDVSAKYGFDFMRPLVSAMVHDDPAKRPTIDEVVVRFGYIRERLSWWKLRSRVVKKDDFLLHLPRMLNHWYRRIGYILMRVPAIPTPKP